MPRRVPAISLCLVLLAAPAFAQSGQTGAAATLPRAATLPGSAGAAAGPGAGPAGSDAGKVNDQNSGTAGQAGAKSSTGTGPLRGGGGPNGQHGGVSGQR